MITIKMLLLFNKSMNYFHMVITAIIYNLFATVFIKKAYIRDESLGIEIKDKSLKRLNFFKTFFKYSIIGYIMNMFWFIYVYDRLEFYFLDDSKLY